MAQFKFWNIGEANAEIERLSTELATAKVASVASPDVAKLTGERDSALTALSTVTAERDTLIAAVSDGQSDTAKLIAGHEKALREVDASVDARASQKALNIVAAQGAKPIETKASGAAPGVDSTKPKNELRGLAKAIAAHKADNKK